MSLTWRNDEGLGPWASPYELIYRKQRPKSTTPTAQKKYSRQKKHRSQSVQPADTKYILDPKVTAPFRFNANPPNYVRILSHAGPFQDFPSWSNKSTILTPHSIKTSSETPKPFLTIKQIQVSESSTPSKPSPSPPTKRKIKLPSIAADRKSSISSVVSSIDSSHELTTVKSNHLPATRPNECVSSKMLSLSNLSKQLHHLANVSKLTKYCAKVSQVLGCHEALIWQFHASASSFRLVSCWPSSAILKPKCLEVANEACTTGQITNYGPYECIYVPICHQALLELEFDRNEFAYRLDQEILLIISTSLSTNLPIWIQKMAERHAMRDLKLTQQIAIACIGYRYPSLEQFAIQVNRWTKRVVPAAKGFIYQYDPRYQRFSCHAGKKMQILNPNVPKGIVGKTIRLRKTHIYSTNAFKEAIHVNIIDNPTGNADTESLFSMPLKTEVNATTISPSVQYQIRHPLLGVYQVVTEHPHCILESEYAHLECIGLILQRVLNANLFDPV